MKILVECHHTIGDVVMTFPALQNLRELYPNAQIAYLGGLQSEIPLIMHTGNVQKCYIHNVKENTILDLFKLIFQFRREHYDLGIAMGQSPRGFDVLLLKLAGCKEIVSMKNVNALYKGYKQVDISMYKHRVLQNIEYIKALGGSGAICSKTINVDSKIGEKILVENGMKDTEKIIGLFLGTGDFFYRKGKDKVLYNTKKWKLNNFVELADRLIEEGYIVLLLGGEKEKIDIETSKVTFNEKCVNLIGKLSLLSTISVMTKCKMIVGGDTGPMHCAAAAGVPTITLFGPTDSELIGPYGQNATYVYGSNECTKCFSECSEKGYQCIDGACMESISVEQVYNIILKCKENS